MKGLFLHIRRLLLRRLERPRKRYEQRVFNNMDKLYQVIRPGDVLLVEGRSEMSGIIKLFSSSQWSHAALYVGDAFPVSSGQTQNYIAQAYGDDAGPFLVEAFSGDGVIASPLEKYANDNIRLCRPYGISDPDLNEVITHVTSKLGMRYDDQNITDIAWMILRSAFGLRNKLTIRACLGNCNEFQVICSGMIAQAFQSVGYPIVPSVIPRNEDAAYDDRNPYGGGLLMRHYTQITPRDFDLSPNFEIIKFNIIGTSKFDYKSLWIEKT